MIIIEEEDHKRRVKRRLRRIIHAHGGIEPSDEFLRHSIKKGFRFDDSKWREVLEYEIKSFKPDFCFLDVFNRLHAKDIRDPQAMAEIVLFLDQLNREYQTTFVILHHTRKTRQEGSDDHDEIMGSRILGGWSEASVFFSKTKEKGLLKVGLALKDEPEDGSFEPEFMIRLKDTDDGQGTSFEYLGAPQEKRAESELRGRILAELTDWRTVKQVAETLKISKPTARENLNALVDLKLAEKEHQGRGFAYRAKETGNSGKF